MATIRAPFNFVPLSDKVVFPDDWAKDISQDIPFEDGICGMIEVEVEAVTPIYVRNGHKGVSDKDSEELKRLKASDEYRSFSKSPAGDYFIPATSIKGELRHLVEILSFGKMSRIGNKKYKEQYPIESHEYLSKNHTSKKYDFADCMFGSVDGLETLRGRIHVSHAYCARPIVPTPDEIAPYLGSPKPTYYPIYIQQNAAKGCLEGRFKSMMDADARLRGWKMYPSSEKPRKFGDVPDNQKDNTNPSKPLGGGSQFTFSIHVHNLREVELGALLYAIKLNGQSNHMLGFAKPYGYGSCKYVIKKNVEGQKDVDEYIEVFRSYMKEQIPDYENTPQLRELFALLNPFNSTVIMRPLEYMTLKEYNLGKRESPHKGIYGQCLPLYSELLPSEEEISKVRKKREEKELKMQQERELQIQKEKERKQAEIVEAKKREESEEKESIAREAYEKQDYERALTLFKEAAAVGYATFEAEINYCSLKLHEGQRLSSDIETFLAPIAIASIPAFANNLKKRNTVSPITLVDAPAIANKLKGSWPSLNRATRSSWLVRAKWSPIEKELGPEITDAIYESIKDLPLK